MAISQLRSRRKITGGRYHHRSKKLRNRGNLPTLTYLSEKSTKIERTKGGNEKIKLLSNNTANVYNSKTKKYEKLKIITITDNPANRNYIRRNIMTKGALVKTEKGIAKITSRPGHEGTINAVLIEKT